MANHEDYQTPFATKVIAIEMFKFDGSEMIDLRAQVVEFSIFESIFAPLVKVEMLVLDYIGLFFNFPLTGEEYFRIVLESPADNDHEDKAITELLFVVDYIDNIKPSNKARNVTYRIGLVSIEALANARNKISRTFQGLVSDAAQIIFDNYVVAPTLDLFPNVYTAPAIDIQRTLEYRTFVCPMMNPLRFMQLLRKYSQPQTGDSGAKYLFYQTSEGFHFKSVESLLLDDDARISAELPQKRFIYIADHAISSVDPTKNQYRSITNLNYNKRFATLEKVPSGYFENSYFEINMFERRISITGHQHVHDDVTAGKLDQFSMNSNGYISAVQSIDNPDLVNIAREERSNRTKYMLNNNIGGRDGYPVHALSNVWGQQQETMVGLNQIDLTITVSGDFRLHVGNLIYCELPEMHGYNEVNEEEYVSGLFLISELKHLMTMGGLHSTVLRINKNSFRSTVAANSVFEEAIPGGGAVR